MFYIKKTCALFLALLFVFALCSCGDNQDSSNDATQDSATVAPVIPQQTEKVEKEKSQKSSLIVGTWTTKDIDDDLFFIFEDNGDAFVKYGSCTIYGDYFETENDEGQIVFDIDLGQFLYNEYEATFENDTMVLKSDAAAYNFKKAKFYDVNLPTPDTDKVDSDLVGNWGSNDSYECYEFRDDGTATITDMYNMATIDCVFECEDGTVKLTYLSTETKTGTKEYSYSVDNDKAEINHIDYERVK